MKTALPNFQFSIFNFQSNLNVLKFKFKNSFQIKNFKLKIILVICLLIFLFKISPALAQTNNQYTAPNTNPDVPKNLHTWTQNVMIEVMSAMVCQLAGVDPINPNQACLGVDQTTGKIGFGQNGGGAIGLMGNMISILYTPALHTSDYFNYLSANFGLAKPAYAQGVGFTGLTPLISLWTVFRNIVYLLFVVAFVVIGLAIMLRVKIDPRTVMSIENQIPKIIISIILVTFSFAIAGFLIDMMYVGTYLAVNVISSADPATANQLSAKTTANLNEQPLAFYNNVNNDIGPTKSGIIDTVIQGEEGVRTVIYNLFFKDNNQHLAAVLSTPDAKNYGKDCGFLGLGCIGLKEIGGAVFQIIAGLIQGILGIIAALIILIAILFALLQLWFQLIKAYIYILIDVVIAPFFIVLGIFPGVPVGFGAWIRDIVANLSAFPVTIAMFLLGKVFMTQFAQVGANQVFVPPLIGNLAAPQAIGALIGLGIILITPQVVTMMRDYLKSPQFKYSSAVGQSFGAALGGGKNIISTGAVAAFGTSFAPGASKTGFGAVARKLLGI